jgi:hypothetical protein
LYEKFPTIAAALDGKMEMQWSNFYSDLYCKEEKYVAIFDSDAVLTMKVTPDLMFMVGKPVNLLSRDFQRGLWSSASNWMLKLSEKDKKSSMG